MKKKSILFMFVFVLALFLSACSSTSNVDSNQEDKSEGNESGNIVEEANNEEQVTLRMSWWGPQDRHDKTQQIIELFEKENPNITIKPQFSGYDGYFEKLAAEAAGNNLPDIMQQNFGEYLNQYADKNLLADLTPFIENGSINLEGVSESIIESTMKEGKILGVPAGINALAAIYNKTMLEEAGVGEPEKDWTWEDYQDIARKVHKATGEFGTSHIGPHDAFEYYLRTKGYQLFNEDGTNLGYDDDQLLIDFLEMTKGLIDEGVSPSYEVTQQVEGTEDELIVHGRSPFLFRWSNEIVTISNVVKDQEIEMTLFPSGGQTEAMYLKPAMIWSISENSEHKEEAAKFIDFYTNTLEIYEIDVAGRGVPIKESIRESMSENLSEVDQKVYNYIQLVTENGSSIATNAPPELSEILSKLGEIEEHIMYDQMTPEEGAISFREEVTKILNR